MIESLIHESPETVASHYDDLDDFYREIWGPHVHHGFWEKGDEESSVATENLIKYLLKDVSLSERTRVCDIGCGYGETARFIARTYGLNVTGLSVSQKQIDFGNQIPTGGNVRLFCRDWMNNKLPGDSFELALSIESSEHMPDLLTFFKEAHRVLVPGGTLKICAWLSKDDPQDAERKYLLEPICTEGRMHLSTVGEYQDLFRKTGFVQQKFEDITFNVKKTWTLCLLRCAQKFLTDRKYIRFMMKDPSKNKKFLISLLRIRLAYETRSMRYGIFTAIKEA